MRKLFSSLLIALTLTLFISCEKEEKDIPEQEKDRVLLFYMPVDEVNISFDWYDKMEAIMEGAAGTSGDILIYSDPDRSAPRLDKIVVNKNNTTYETLEEYEQENSASPEVLSRLINKMLELYPNRSYGLVVFTHSSGWLPAGTLLNPLAVKSTRSIGIDDNPGTDDGRQEMELSDFSRVLPDGLFDFIIFESCLTANVEVAYELRKKTPYIVASAAEIVSPGFVPVYKRKLSALADINKDVEETLCDFASTFFEEAKSSDKYDHSATIGVIKTAYMEELGHVVREVFAHPAAEIESLAGLQYFDRYSIYNYPSYSRYFDLEEYIERIASPTQFTAFREVMGKTLPYKEATQTFLYRYQGFTITRHCGLTTYIERPEYNSGQINTAWRQTAWYQATH